MDEVGQGLLVRQIDRQIDRLIGQIRLIRLDWIGLDWIRLDRQIDRYVDRQINKLVASHDISATLSDWWADERSHQTSLPKIG